MVAPYQDRGGDMEMAKGTRKSLAIRWTAQRVATTGVGGKWVGGGFAHLPMNSMSSASVEAPE